jgi:hypothetical protein
MDVVRPAVQQDHSRAVLGAEVCVADVEHAGIDLMQRPERVGQTGRRCIRSGRRRLRVHQLGQPEIEQADAGDGGAEQTAATGVDGVRHGGSSFK